MKYRSDKHQIEIVFLLLLFCLFLFSAILLVTMGTREYQQIVTSMQDNNSLRTPQAYLLQKVRRNREQGAIRLEEVQGVTTLAIRQEIAGQPYVTRIYTYEGSLREMLTPLGNYDFTLAAGTRILPLQNLDFTQVGEQAILAEIREEGGQTSTAVIAISP